MSALKLCKRSKGLDTGNKEQVLMHTEKHAVWINMGVQEGCFFMCKDNICAGDTNITLWVI